MGLERSLPIRLKRCLKCKSRFGPTLASIQRASDQVNGLASDIRQVVGAGDGSPEGGGPLQKLARKAEETMKNVDETLIAFNTILSDPKLQTAISATAERLPELIKEAEAVMTQTKKTIASFEGVGISG